MTAQPHLLTIMAHPDDAELWAGGTIARHIHDGGTATIAVPRTEPTRVSEAQAGARILQADLLVLDDLSADAISAAITTSHPDILITHNPDDIHPEHRQCAEYVLAAIPNSAINHGCPKRLYHCDGYNNLDRTGNPLNLPTRVDVTTHWETKMSALAAHSSQPIKDHFGPMAEILGHLHGLRSGCRYAEGFHALPILGTLPQAQAL